MASECPLTSTPFSLKDRVIVVTGGGTGIGFSLAAAFVKHGAKKVILTGRREEVLKSAQAEYPNHFDYIVNDVGVAKQRQQLFEEVSKRYPDVSVLVNNAGIQRRIPPAKDKEALQDWAVAQAELDINLAAPIHLSFLFAPLFLQHANGGAIIHITSGRAFIPAPFAPGYAATKAGLHAYAMAQRHSFQSTNVRIVEAIPPAVKSKMGGVSHPGLDVDEYSESMIKELLEGNLQIGPATADEWKQWTKEHADAATIALRAFKPEQDGYYSVMVAASNKPPSEEDSKQTSTSST